MGTTIELELDAIGAFGHGEENLPPVAAVAMEKSRSSKGKKE
jgi:hypothetical protein